MYTGCPWVDVVDDPPPSRLVLVWLVTISSFVDVVVLINISGQNDSFNNVVICWTFLLVGDNKTEQQVVVDAVAVVVVVVVVVVILSIVR